MIIPPAPYSYTGEVTTVDVPTLSGTYTYNGEFQTPVWNYNEDAISIFGQTNATNAGSYDVTFSLNNKRTSQWSDGTKTDKTGTWSIGKAQNTITFNPTSLSLTYYHRTETVSISYFGDGQLSYSINNDSATATKSGKTINVTAAKTGDSIITVNVSEETNYLATSGTFNVAVDMAKYFTVTVNSDDIDMGTVSGSGTVKEGNSITVTATANTGYKFAGWQVDGEIVSTALQYTFTPTDDIILTATFVELTVYTVTVSIDPENSGTVTGAGNYYEDEQVTVTANPNENYRFVHWIENFAPPPPIETEYTVTFNVSDSLNQTKNMITSIGQLLANDIEITKESQSFVTKDKNILVSYTLNTSISKRRKVIVNEESIGFVSNEGDNVSISIPISNDITINFELVYFA